MVADRLYRRVREVVLGRPEGDRRRRRPQWRDFWLVVALAFGLVAILRAEHSITQQQRGRQTATSFICAVLSAEAEAGRKVLGSSGSGPETRFTRNLERLGYPPLAVRQLQAQLAAANYVTGIVNSVEQQVGHKGAKVIRPDGTIDCRLFARLVLAGPRRQ